ncbi:hypothetical protein Ancab_025002, partial [Ancistrocladus abbreviatus]
TNELDPQEELGDMRGVFPKEADFISEDNISEIDNARVVFDICSEPSTHAGLVVDRRMKVLACDSE